MQKTGNQPENAARHAGECQHPVKQQRMIMVMKGYSLDSGLRQNDGIGQKRLNSKVCGCPDGSGADHEYMLDFFSYKGEKWADM